MICLNGRFRDSNGYLINTSCLETTDMWNVYKYGYCSSGFADLLCYRPFFLVNDHQNQTNNQNGG